MDPRVKVERRRAVALITLDNPPVNALSRGIAGAVIEAVKAAEADPALSAIVLTGAGKSFTGGADIREFGETPDPNEPDLRAMIRALEGAKKPVVAALRGNVLGGGLETALGCHWRLGTPEARYGFPEVKIGLLPGAGGTQRAPRLIGVAPALELCLSGEFIDSKRALSLGLIDREVAGDLLEEAVAWAAAKGGKADGVRRVRDMRVDTSGLAPGFFAAERAKLAAKTRGLMSPALIVDCLEIATQTPIDEGLARERDLFEQCRTSPQSRALIHVFFAERAAGKVKGVGPDTPAREIARAGVVGAGTMGGGIAMCFASAGIPVTLVEANEDALAHGLATIHKNYERSRLRGRLSEGEMHQRLARIAGSTALESLRDADVVIEAVFEELALKQEIFRKLGALCRKDAILATNTSTLDVDAIAAVTSRPERVVGTHFFSPANVMRLLETVRGAQTSPETLAAVLKLGRRIGKLPVVVGVCDGFVGNRMLYPYLRQAYFLIEEGALPEEVDRALVDFGLAMGPFAMNDLAGLDVGYRVRKAQAATRPKNWRYARLPDKLVEAGRFGQKNGRGWYRYEVACREPKPDAEVRDLILAESAALGIERRKVGEAEIIERCLFALINEGAKILEEGIAERASDIDLIWINGYGLPAWRGGPMFYADTLGLERVNGAVARYDEQFGEWWAPAPLLKRLTEAGKRFNG